MSLDEFYRATPREAVAVINAHVYRRDAEYRQGLRFAWVGAMLQRARALPKLEEILPPPLPAVREAMRRGGLDYRGRPKPTPAQEWEVWNAIAVSANAVHEARVSAGLEEAEGLNG